MDFDIIFRRYLLTPLPTSVTNTSPSSSPGPRRGCWVQDRRRLRPPRRSSTVHANARSGQARTSSRCHWRQQGPTVTAAGTREFLLRPRQASGVLWLGCMSVCLCVSARDHIFGTTCLIFTRFLCIVPMTVARFSSGGVVIRYVLLYGWIHICS